jgi:hypothetical protein
MHYTHRESMKKERRRRYQIEELLKNYALQNACWGNGLSREIRS